MLVDVDGYPNKTVRLALVPSPTRILLLVGDEIKEEVKWWEWRLDIIREFGKDDPKRTTGHLSMSAQESDDDQSGVF